MFITNLCWYDSFSNLFFVYQLEFKLNAFDSFHKHISNLIIFTNTLNNSLPVLCAIERRQRKSHNQYILLWLLKYVTHKIITLF